MIFVIKWVGTSLFIININHLPDRSIVFIDILFGYYPNYLLVDKGIQRLGEYYYQ